MKSNKFSPNFSDDYYLTQIKNSPSQSAITCNM